MPYAHVVLVMGKLYQGLQVTPSFSNWGFVLKGCFERGVFWRAKITFEGHWRLRSWTLHPWPSCYVQLTHQRLFLATSHVRDWIWLGLLNQCMPRTFLLKYFRSGIYAGVSRWNIIGAHGNLELGQIWCPRIYGQVAQPMCVTWQLSTQRLNLKLAVLFLLGPMFLAKAKVEASIVDHVHLAAH